MSQQNPQYAFELTANFPLQVTFALISLFNESLTGNVLYNRHTAIENLNQLQMDIACGNLPTDATMSFSSKASPSRVLPRVQRVE